MEVEAEAEAEAKAEVELFLFLRRLCRLFRSRRRRRSQCPPSFSAIPAP